MNKSFPSSDSLPSTISIFPSQEENSSESIIHGYSAEFQAMLDGLDQEETDDWINSKKKKRLSLHQVKALETIFEEEIRLEPDRKVRIAAELGLQPRQVSIWFQNRRARWRTKQLERDYVLLKDNYDALKFNYDYLEQEKASLNAKVIELREELISRELITSTHSVSIEGENPVLKNGPSEYDGDSRGGVLKEEDDIMKSLITSNGSSCLSYNPTMMTGSWFQLTNLEQSTLFSREEEEKEGGGGKACNFFYSVDQAPSLRW